MKIGKTNSVLQGENFVHQSEHSGLKSSKMGIILTVRAKRKGKRCLRYESRGRARLLKRHLHRRMISMAANTSNEANLAKRIQSQAATELADKFCFPDSEGEHTYLIKSDFVLMFISNPEGGSNSVNNDHHVKRPSTR